MTDLLQLLKAIILSPEEDTPRLMYADCLEELPAVYKACPKCNGAKSVMSRWRIAEMDADDYGTSTGPCGHCNATGRALDATNRERAKFIRNAIARRAENLECYRWPRSYDVGFEPVPISGPWHIEFDRGFGCDWMTDSATFLKHADALIWHPSQVVQCDKCRNPELNGLCGRCYKPSAPYAHHSGEDYDGTWRCDRVPVCPFCAGKRCQPRECPPTAQPITSVTLTNMDAWSGLRDGWMVPSNQGDYHVNASYPGVKFILHHGQPA